MNPCLVSTIALEVPGASAVCVLMREQEVDVFVTIFHRNDPVARACLPSCPPMALVSQVEKV
jgi:hypothetical protein